MLEKLVIGLVVTTLGALLVYAFRIRQLYVVIPRLFSVSLLTTNGKLAEIRIYNKGRATENEVMVSLDPSLKYEIVASSDSTCTFEHSAIKIPRIPPGDDFSVLLLVEGGDFSRERISTISSKDTKGRFIQGIENVLPNAGNALLVIFAFITILVIPIAGLEYYYGREKVAAEKLKTDQLARLDYLGKDGWSELDSYSNSTFRGNYADGEFPIHMTKLSRVGEAVEIQFRIVNKSAAELSVTAFSEWPHRSEDPRVWDGRDIFSHKVEPQGANNLTIKLYFPKTKKGEATIKFQLSVGKENFLSATKRVAIDI